MVKKNHGSLGIGGEATTANPKEPNPPMRNGLLEFSCFQVLFGRFAFGYLFCGFSWDEVE
jgi:hypothetical protein